MAVDVATALTARPFDLKLGELVLKTKVLFELLFQRAKGRLEPVFDFTLLFNILRTILSAKPFELGVERVKVNGVLVYHRDKILDFGITVKNEERAFCLPEELLFTPTGYSASLKHFGEERGYLFVDCVSPLEQFVLETSPISDPLSPCDDGDQYGHGGSGDRGRSMDVHVRLPFAMTRTGVRAERRLPSVAVRPDFHFLPLSRTPISRSLFSTAENSSRETRHGP